MVIAIDGPAGAGKSTIAGASPTRLGLPYLDSGRCTDARRSLRFAPRRTSMTVLRWAGLRPGWFSRTFVLADGIEVKSAELTNGLLAIDLQRLEPERLVRRIEIGATSRIKSPV